ncbi:MAG: helix-turn-helix domain-containing protein [Desulfobulbus sp.]|nr:helix-turn-helix domain-containing protein [Desulfobulbus sp.]
MAEERLNWQQACKVLGCSKSHLYNLINSGDLPAERKGRIKGVTVKRSDCERYLKEWRERTGAEDQ